MLFIFKMFLCFFNVVFLLLLKQQEAQLLLGDRAGDANPLVGESETDFNAKWPFKVIQGHLFRYL